MLATGTNNLFVLLIYCLAGILVKAISGSKLAPFAPWAVFSLHMAQAIIVFFAYASNSGFLPCLAFVLPHAWLEVSGFVFGCQAGSRLCWGRRPFSLIAAATVLIIISAWVETYITPFPFGTWLR